jgi:hypothetical protein
MACNGGSMVSNGSAMVEELPQHPMVEGLSQATAEAVFLVVCDPSMNEL